MSWIVTGCLLVLIAIIALWLWAIRPERRKEKWHQPFQRWDYAHRGLHKADLTVPENTLAAFHKAMEAGYGMELDVRLTADGEVVVFHDARTKRVCGTDVIVEETTLADLQKLFVGKSEERIPLFSQVLELVNGQTPLIVEIKAVKKLDELCEKTAALLADYPGLYCIESFHPLAVRWFLKNRPDTIRGFLTTSYAEGSKNMPFLLRFAATSLLVNALIRPDFVAIDWHHRNNWSLRVCKKLYGVQEVCWTVRDLAVYKKLKEDGALVIFEHILP